MNAITKPFKPQTKDEIVALLKEDVCVVQFVKANGETRLMVCTLSEKILPPIDPNKESRRTSVDGPDMVTVWDVEAEGWRRFKLDALTTPVIKYEGMDGV